MLTSSSASLRHPILHPSASLHPKHPTLHLTPSSSLKFQPNPKPQAHLLSNSHHCLVGVPLLGPRRRPNVVAMSKSPKVEEQKFSQEGLVTESLPNGMFRIKLDNADTIIGYICGKIRKSFIRILPGDRVLVEVSRYDTARGRIVYRLKKEKENNVRGANDGKKNNKNKMSNMSLQPINTNRGADGSGQTTPKGSRLPAPEQPQCPSAPRKPQPRSKYINYQ